MDVFIIFSKNIVKSYESCGSCLSATYITKRPSILIWRAFCFFRGQMGGRYV